jgi:hypothetical protein
MMLPGCGCSKVLTVTAPCACSCVQRLALKAASHMQLKIFLECVKSTEREMKREIERE